MAESSPGLGEMALSDRDLGLAQLPSIENGEQKVEELIIAGRTFINKKIESLKQFFTGPMPEAQSMAFAEMVILMGGTEEAKARLMLMQHEPKSRKTLFKRMQEEETNGAE